MADDEETLTYPEILAQHIVARVGLINIRHSKRMEQQQVDSLFKHKVGHHFGNDAAFELLSKQIERCIDEVMPANDSGNYKMTLRAMQRAADTIDRYLRNIGLVSDPKAIFHTIALVQQTQERGRGF